MKHQQVVVDYWSMVKTSCTCLLLAFSGYVLIKMVQTIFWLPGHLKNNQKRLEDLAAQYKIDLNNLDEEQTELLSEDVEAGSGDDEAATAAKTDDEEKVEEKKKDL